MKKLFILLSLYSCLYYEGVAQSLKDCRTMPSYVNSIGFDVQKSGFSTSENKKRGLCFVEFGTGENHSNRVYQHKSWSKAGYLGPMLITETGDIFTAPIPTVNLYYNKPSEQNFLYKIDKNTQEMERIATLPTSNPPNAENPFGLMGLAYDCDTKVIYASSLAGSTRDKENGRIFALNRETYQIVDTLDKIDCMGVGIAFIQGEKRLLLGKARNGSILSVALNSEGKFVGSRRKELSLEGLGPRGDDIARKIRVLPDGTLQIQGVEFYFNLIAPTEKQETKYLFKAVNQKWMLIKIE
jgi:hypothetical protein